MPKIICVALEDEDGPETEYVAKAHSVPFKEGRGKSALEAVGSLVFQCQDILDIVLVEGRLWP